MARTIKVFEHERLGLRPDAWGQKLEPQELQKLYDFNDRHDNRYFIGIRDGVKFKNFVGVIQIGGLTLEILPKADKHKETSIEGHESATQTWRNALLRMLAITRKIRLESVSDASLKRRSNSILDLYFELFLGEVETLLHRGLVKKYRNHQGNLHVLKGRLNFSRNIQKNLIHQEQFYTHHQVYDQDHLLHQIVLRALVILGRTAASPLVKERLARIRLDFPETKHINIEARHFDLLVENRKTIHYREAVKIAKMIILNYSPDIKGGREDMLALLFDMNKLWEEFVYRAMIRSDESGATIKYQNSKTFWYNKSSTKTIRPDIVVENGKEIFVIDTKWKVLDAEEPSDDDLKQMFSYNLYWKSFHGVLLYPSTKPKSSPVPGNYREGFEKEHTCTLAFVDVLDAQGKLDTNCCDPILNLLYGSPSQVSAD
jgi:5-methylcytosine-specific restriction enzyme subunit McrC